MSKLSLEKQIADLTDRVTELEKKFSGRREAFRSVPERRAAERKKLRAEIIAKAQTEAKKTSKKGGSK